MGPSVKFVSPITGPISERKNGGKFVFRKKDHTQRGGGAGGGSEGEMVKDHTFPLFFIEPFPYKTCLRDMYSVHCRFPLLINHIFGNVNIFLLLLLLKQSTFQKMFFVLPKNVLQFDISFTCQANRGHPQIKLLNFVFLKVQSKLSSHIYYIYM